MIENLWATPLFRQVVDNGQAFNQSFSEFVLKRMQNESSVSKSNVGGWHSDQDLLDWPLAEIAQLKDWVFRGVQSIMSCCNDSVSGWSEIGFRCVAWANVSRSGEFHRPHSHPNSSWSGVYYVATGEQQGESARGGAIEFMDPRSGINTFAWPGNPFDRRVTIAPEPGLLLIFPSWLQHYVLPFDGRSERISIAFNFTITEARRKE